MRGYLLIQRGVLHLHCCVYFDLVRWLSPGLISHDFFDLHSVKWKGKVFCRLLLGYILDSRRPENMSWLVSRMP